MTHPQFQNLQRLRDHIASLPEIDMSVVHECGTPHCGFGHGVAMGLWPRLALGSFDLFADSLSVLLDGKPRFWIDPEVKAVLDLPADDFYILFSGCTRDFESENEKLLMLCRLNRWLAVNA